MVDYPSILPSVAEFKRATKRKWKSRKYSGLTQIDDMLERWHHGVQRAGAGAKTTLLLDLQLAVYDWIGDKGVALTTNGRLRVRHPRDPEGMIRSLIPITANIISEISRQEAQRPANQPPRIAPVPLGAPNGQPVRAVVPSNRAPVGVARAQPGHKPARAPVFVKQEMDETMFATLKRVSYFDDAMRAFYRETDARRHVLDAEDIREAKQRLLFMSFGDTNEFTSLAAAIGNTGRRVTHTRICSFHQIITAMKNASIQSPVMVCVGDPDQHWVVPVIVVGTKHVTDLWGESFSGFRVIDVRGGRRDSSTLFPNGIYASEDLVGNEETMQIVPELGYIKAT